MRGITHGTNSGYQHHKCRCLDCCDAKRKYEAERKARKQENIPELVGPKPVIHGTYSAYAKKCRCEICCAFMRGYNMGYGLIRKESGSDEDIERFEEQMIERKRVCGTADSYSFGCECDLCLTIGRDLWMRQVNRGAA